MNDRALRLLGLMKKANAIEPGETKTGAAAKAKKAVLLVIASDSSENAFHRASNFSATNTVPLVKVPYTKQEIADTIGLEICSMFAVKDIGFAKAFLQYTAETFPEYDDYSEAQSYLEHLGSQLDKGSQKKERKTKRRTNI